MPAYARKTTIEDEFGARRAPGGAILCGNCNRNLADPDANPAGEIFLVYVDKKHLDANAPHDCYCGTCMASAFPRAKIV